MIGRLWSGCTTAGNAAAYQEHLQQATLPALREIHGHHGAYVLRRDVDNQVEFIVVTLWESLDAVRAFAGHDYEAAVIPPEARALLSLFDERARHYELATPNSKASRRSAKAHRRRERDGTLDHRS